MRNVARICVALGLLSVAAACSPAMRAGEARLEPTVVATTAPEPAPRAPDWRPHFQDISDGGVRIDLTARTLTYWAPGGEEARTFSIAVPRSPEFQRTGRTTIVRRREGPDWTPTPAMLRRDPSLPTYVPPGPNNPLGEYALYLGWRYYAIHGTNDQASVGTRASSGCIRLAKDDIEWLFENAEIGTPVLVDGVVTGPRGRLPDAPTPRRMRSGVADSAARAAVSEG